MWRDILRRLGMSPDEPVQPDVSAHTILNLLLQTEGREDLLIPALGSLYERVLSNSFDGEGAPQRGLSLDLRRAQQPYAALICLYDGPSGSDVPATQCTFTYWDPADEVSAFLQQASGWAVQHLGTLAQSKDELGAPQWTAVSDGPIRSLTLQRPTDDDESEARLLVTFQPPRLD